MRIGGVIVAGGRSTRMGQEKAFAEIGGQSILTRIVLRIGPQVAALAINANGDQARFAGFGLPVIEDIVSVGTPLAGLHAALAYGRAQGFDAVLTVPSDAPFLPRDLVARLAGDGAAVAASGGQAHYLTGLWPVRLLSQLEATLPRGRHADESQHPASLPAEKSGTLTFVRVTPKKRTIRVQDWAGLCNARVVEWPSRPYDPFYNVNTPQELAEAERIAAVFAP